MTGVFARAARRTRQDHLLDGVPGSERGSVALGVAIVALTTRIHHYGTSTGTPSTAGLVIFVAVVIFFIVSWFMRNRRR